MSALDKSASLRNSISSIYIKKVWQLVILGPAALAGFAIAYYFISNILVFIKITGIEIRMAYLSLGLILFFAVFDLAMRMVAFSDIQSVSLDIIIFSVIYRLSLVITAKGQGFDILVLLVFLYFVSTQLFARFFKDPSTEKLRVSISNALSGLSIENEQTIIDMCSTYHHSDLWGVFKRGLWRPKNQIDELNKILAACSQGKAAKISYNDCTLPLIPHRFLVVLVLSFLSSLAILSNGITHVS